MKSDTSTKAIVWGLTGGLAATIIMDAACAGFFAGVGLPVDLTYSFIGNVAGGFFSKIGFDVAGSRLLGAVVHFCIGIGLGGPLGFVLSRIGTARVEVLWKGVLIGIFYIEIVSQPIVASAPLLGNMAWPEILNWYALSTGMHLLYGVILGGVLSYSQKGVASTSYAV